MAEHTVIRRRPDEVAEVWLRRFNEARAAGLTLSEATAFAGGPENVGVLRQLVHGGCPPALIARIVL